MHFRELFVKALPLCAFKGLYLAIGVPMCRWPGISWCQAIRWNSYGTTRCLWVKSWARSFCVHIYFWWILSSWICIYLLLDMGKLTQLTTMSYYAVNLQLEYFWHFTLCSVLVIVFMSFHSTWGTNESSYSAVNQSEWPLVLNPWNTDTYRLNLNPASLIQDYVVVR